MKHWLSIEIFKINLVFLIFIILHFYIIFILFINFEKIIYNYKIELHLLLFQFIFIILNWAWLIYFNRNLLINLFFHYRLILLIIIPDWLCIFYCLSCRGYFLLNLLLCCSINGLIIWLDLLLLIKIIRF